MMTRIMDLTTLLILFGALTFAYKPRFRLGPTLAGLLLCLAGAHGQILLEEKIQTLHFLLYILAFIVWGLVYARCFTRGLFQEKCVMVIVYVSSFFFCTDIIFFLRSALFPASTVAAPLMRIGGALLSGLFLCWRAIHTTRRLPALHWASMISVTALNLMVYYAMHHQRVPGMLGTNAVVSLLLLAALMVTFFLCGSLIHYYENGIRQVALSQSQQAEKDMVSESLRLNRELRMYRHEVNNHLATVQALLEQGEADKALSLLREAQHSAAALGRDSVHTGNPIADAVLNRKIAEAAQKNIPITVDACIGGDLPLLDTELSSLLTNLLNNAIEGSRHVERPEITVQIYPTRCYLCVSIRNRADIASLSGNPLLNTTKQSPDLHGFGLAVVRDIAQRYHGSATFQVEEATETFVAQVMLLVHT